MKEVWKDIIGYEGLYQISNMGTVKSLPKKIINGSGWQNRPEKILKGEISNKGYRRVSLNDNYKIEKVSVHRLVALAFIPNSENKSQVNHKNGNKIDNKLINLEWMTSSENQLHSIKIGTRKIKYGMVPKTRRLTERQVREIRDEYQNNNISLRKIAIKYGVHYCTINNITSGRLYKSVI